MSSKELDTDIIKPALVGADEEVVEGHSDQINLEKNAGQYGANVAPRDCFHYAWIRN